VKCPRHESNVRTWFRKPLLYPLSYGGSQVMKHSALNPSVHHKRLVLKPLLYPLSYGGGQNILP
jgi:hypothetical protein